jgi:hypothetical protein
MLLAVLVCASIVLAGGLYAFGATTPASKQGDRGRLQRPYTVYWVGKAFDGLTLSGRIRRLEPPDPGETFGADFYSYLYGSCTSDSIDGACPLPLEIQSWAACKRNLSVYTEAPDGRPVPHENLKIRGVPAALFEEGTRLEIYTGTTTVVIFGSDLDRMNRAAVAMFSVDGRIKPKQTLPAPAPGALQGKLKC